MPAARWLPNGYSLGAAGRIAGLIASGPVWQIYETSVGRALITSLELAGRWVDCELIEEDWISKIDFGSASLRSLFSPRGVFVGPLAMFDAETKTDLLSFAASFRATRQAGYSGSLHDALFVEHHSRLLPTWSIASAADDSHVLGQWITGGVDVPVTARRRLGQLAGWLTAADLDEVLARSGILAADVSHNGRSDVADRDRAGGHVAAAALNRSQVSGDGEFSLAGRPALEHFFREHVIDIVRHPDRYSALGIGFPGAIILHGPPGCGKTYAVERLIEYLDWPLFRIESSTVASPYIHETSRKIAEVFDDAIASAPSVIVIDEMDAYLGDRQAASGSGHHVEEVAEFLRRIPEAANQRVLVVGMTNQIDMIDAAIRRRGRFDHVIEVGMPSRVEVEALLDGQLGQLPCEDDLESEGAIEALCGRPLSDATYLVRDAARRAARSGMHQLDQASLDEAVAGLAPLPTGRNPIGFGPG